MWHDRPQQFAGNFKRPLLLAEPRSNSGRAYWQSDVRRLVPFAIGQTCWVGRRNIRCPQCRQIQPSSSPSQDLGFDTYKDYEQKFLVICAKQEALFLPWVYCTDSFWSEDEPAWHRMGQSISSVTSNEEFSTGAVLLEGHRIFAFPGYAEVATTVVYLAATDKLLIERGTESSSIRKHKLFLSNVLDQLQELNKIIILEGEKSHVYLVCQALQITLLDDAALDASHLSADIELDGRWTF